MGAGIQRWWRDSSRYDQECGEHEAKWNREQSRIVFDSAMDGIDVKLRCYLENCRAMHTTPRASDSHQLLSLHRKRYSS